MISNTAMTESIINHVRVPHLIYGTAWKENSTTELTLNALMSGFTGIDTANQRKHYYEAGVGDALEQFYQQSNKQRQDLFLQTKFTYAAGQDNRLPYDSDANYTTQVIQSFESSLEHLQTNYLDAFLLHGPSQREGLGDADLEVWQAMESLYRDGKVKLLGISNVSADQLEQLNYQMAIKPVLVQNRCFASTGWDRAIRDICRRHDIQYQGFSLLTANPDVFKTEAFQEIVHTSGLTPAQVVFQAAIQSGMIALTGTSNQKHMQEDLNCLQSPLSEEALQTIEGVLLK